MFDETALRELASIQTEGPILSVYLNVDPTRRTAEEYKLELRELLKQVSSEVPAEDLEVAKRYIEYEYDWSGRGLAMFSNAAEGIWYVYPLAVPVRSGATVARRPYISPLVEIDGLYGKYVVALIDRQGGEFYYFQMGELMDQVGMEGEDVRHTRRGRGSSVHGMRGGSPISGRHEAALVQRNLKDIAADLVDFCQKYHPRRLLLGGSEHTLAQFMDALPPATRELVADTFSSESVLNDAEVREHSFRLLNALEEHEHTRAINTVRTQAAKGMNGVVGLDQTLSVANEGRVQVLVVERSYHQPGYQCQGCGYLTAQQMDRCVFCGGTFTEIPDAVEAVVTQVVDKGGNVKVVNDGQLIEARVGALLRY
ncbi:MAG: hypothetical protein MUF84_12280 [Anaerolineae bacterium]|nr:hypothetical protein [Anaerolineae bacterium]